MIVDERMRTYINSLDMGNTPFLEKLEQEAISDRVPIIRKEMQSFLIVSTNPKLTAGSVISIFFFCF